MKTKNVFDVSEKTEPGFFPCCPLCDNEIRDWDSIVILNSHGSLALGHGDCLTPEDYKGKYLEKEK